MSSSSSILDIHHLYRALMRMTESHVPCHRASSWEEFPCLFTGYCPLSWNRCLLSTAVNSLSKQSWKKTPRERESMCEHRHTKEKHVVSTNLNLCQNALRDQVESSILTRRSVTVRPEESTFSLYRAFLLRRAIKSQLIELSMSAFKEEILLNKIIQSLSSPPLQLFYLSSKAYGPDIHDKDPPPPERAVLGAVLVKGSLCIHRGQKTLFICKKGVYYKNTTPPFSWKAHHLTSWSRRFPHPPAFLSEILPFQLQPFKGRSHGLKQYLLK